MNRLLIPFLVLLFVTLAACVLPSQPDETVAVPSPAATQEADLLESSEDETYATQALAATLALPTASVTPTLPGKPADLSIRSAPAAIPEPVIEYRYAVQAGTPVMTANFLDPDAGCSWMGIGGQVFSRDETPVTGLIVEVGGVLDGQPVLLLAMTGGSTRLGPGGYEITLSDRSVASQGTLWLQLYDLDGAPQSDQIYFDTVAGEGSCEKNLIIVNFSEIGSPAWDYYFPYIFKDARAP